MPTEAEIGQEIGLLLHAHGCAENPDLATALTRYAYNLQLNATVAGVLALTLAQQRAAAGTPRAED